MSVALDYRFDGVSEAARAFARLERALGDPTPIMAAVGVGLVRNTHDRFAAGVGPDGAAWRPLLPAYAAGKRGPGILRESGMLMRSITYRAGRDSVEVGTNRIYAGVHQGGATIVPKAAKALAFRLGNGFVIAQSVTIPARPYLGMSRADEELTLDIVEGALERAIGGS